VRRRSGAAHETPRVDATAGQAPSRAAVAAVAAAFLAGE
jgi:hypothetical protein